MIEKNKKIIILAIVVIIIALLLYFFVFKKNNNGLVLNKQYLSIYPEQTELLIATVEGESKAKINWTSDNPMIASVNENGFVEALSPGYAKIIASTEDGKASNICIIAVMEKEIESIDLQDTEINLKEGQTWELKPIITPEALSDEKITWTSEDENIAMVSEAGQIIARGNGIVKIKGEVLGKEVTCAVIVGMKAESIKINQNELKIGVDEEEELFISKEPDEAIEEEVKWSSSNDEIVEIDENGKLKAKKIGNATITAETVYTKLKDICKVTVVKKYQVKYMEINKTVSITEGEKLGTLPTPTKNGYKLLGWYTKQKGGDKVTKDTVVKTNMTLYPHWQEVETYSVGPGVSTYSRTVTYMGRTFKEYKQNRYNFSYGGGTIKSNGCGPVALAGVLSGYMNVDVTAVAKKTGLPTSFDGIKKAASQYGLKSTGLYSYNSNDWNESKVQLRTSQAIEHLKQGHQLIVLVEAMERCRDSSQCNGHNMIEYTRGNHFMAVVAVAKDNSTILILNPLDGKSSWGTMHDLIKYFMPGGGKGFIALYK